MGHSFIAAAIKEIQEMACNLTTDGIQVMGGAEVYEGFRTGKRFRDAKHIQAFIDITEEKIEVFPESII
ncbi:MAG: hypothetical protein R2860_12195 [Desulfobacterales bacterium]